MAKTIDKKVVSRGKNHKADKTSDLLPNLSNPKVYRKFCEDYGKAITPGIESVDRLQAESMEHAFRVVRGGYSYN